jgi:extracellular elastinolytic metalloproteinase
MTFRRALLRAVIAGAAVTLVLAGPSFGVRATATGHGNLRDFLRRASVGPTDAQRAAVRALHARVTWNSFGTPSTLARPGGFLTMRAAGATAVAAARSWLAKHRVIFRLDSVRGLQLETDSKLVGSRGHAVTFQQALGGLKVLNGSGLVTVGLTAGKAGSWKIGFVSSTVVGSIPLKGAAKVSSADAWVEAAVNVGIDKSVANVKATKIARGWTNLRVGGLRDLQRVRLGSFAIGRVAVPAYESLVLDTAAASPAAYRVIVDARNGAVLARTSLVDNFDDRTPLAPVTFNFSGSVPATDGACDAKQGPYTVGAGIRALDGFAAATVPTNDVVLNLYFGTTLIVTADTLFSPEQFHYEPAGGVPPGNYFVEVCDFNGDGPWVSPTTYTGHLTLDDTPAPAPYLARWKAFPANPPLPALDAFPWSNSSTDTRATWCWTAAPGCDIVTGNLASRAPWDFDLHANVPTFTTSGNNNKAATSWTNDLVPSAPQFMPTSTGRDYSFPWTNDWNTRQCNPATPPVPGSTYDDSAAATNLFVMHNRMHDFSYFLGFTEQNWNAQADNFGLTELFRENDPLVGDVQSGAATTTRDNANMITLPDGVSSITNMYMWQPLAGSFYSPCVDGDYDMGVIGHEFGHMIENRMIGKGATRTGFHAGAMGEAFADLDAEEYLHENGFVPTDGENSFAEGTYATGNKEHGIRDYAMNYPQTGAFPTPSTYPHVDPLNFSDVGFDTPGNEVHSDGEIWIATNFSIRQALIDKYNGAFPAGDAGLQAQCANGELPSQNCPGNRRWIQLVYDSFLLDPTGPTMLDARNSMLAADVMRYGGANQKEIWGAFARRGYGQNAALHASVTPATRCAATGSGALQDCDPVPDFASPLENNAQVTFNLVSKETGDPVVGKVYVGHYEARVSPIADTDPATSNSGIDINRDATASFAPGQYEFLAVAPGYGFYRFSAKFNANQVKTQTVVMPTNWASGAGGATVTGDGTSLGNAIDETETTNWSADGRDASGGLSLIAGKQVTINLTGTEAREINHVEVSAMIAPGNSRFAALRSFELWACNAAAGSDCSTNAGYTKVYTSAGDAFPGDAPRPVAPELIMRDFQIPKTLATHLKLVVSTSQCTGGPAYQGEQDADPSATTDCDTNVSTSTAASSRRFVRVAEIEAFKDDPTKG